MSDPVHKMEGVRSAIRARGKRLDARPLLRMRVLVGSDKMPRNRLTVRWLFEPRDVWVGVFWNTVEQPYFNPLAFSSSARFLLVYIGLVPCLPLCVAWRLT